MGVIISDVWKAVKNAIKNGDFFLFKRLFSRFLCLYSIVIVDFRNFFVTLRGPFLCTAWNRRLSS